MEGLVLKYGMFYILFLGLIYLMFRKMLYSLLDPAIFIVPLFSSLLALGMTSDLFLYLILAIMSFWLGMYTVNKNKIQRNFQTAHIYNVLTLKLYTYFIFSIYILVSLYVFSKNGIPLFSDVPSESKISAYNEMGLLRRFVFLGAIVPINLILLILISKKKKLVIVLLLIYCIIKIGQGAKSSLIEIIFPLYYFLTQRNLFKSTINFSDYKKYIIIIFSICVFILINIVSKESEQDSVDPLYGIAFRLMEFGDIMLYYPHAVANHIFDNYSPFQFIGDELNGILGMFRIVPYKEPLGYLMVKGNSLNDTITGPNAIFLIKGDIYFGFIGGVFYSYLVGVIFAFIRKYFFEMKIHDIYWYSLIAFIFFNLISFLRESGGFLSNLFGYIFLTFPLLFISQLLVRYNVKKG